MKTLKQDIPNQQPMKKNRHSIRLQGYDYSQPGAYYLTFITKDRLPTFGSVQNGQMQLSAAGKIAEEHWLTIPTHFPTMELGEYAVMPNHIHGIIVIHTTRTREPIKPTAGERPNGPLPGSIGAMLGAYKMSVTRLVKRELNIAEVWHRNYYEHIIRDEIDWQRIEKYIHANVENWEFDQGIGN